MKKISIAMLIATCITISSCKIIHLSDFKIQPTLSAKLPALEMLTDNKNSVNNIYPMYAMYNPNPYYYNGSVSPEIQTLYNKELEENITNPIGEKYGYAQFKTLVADNGFHGWGLYVLSIFTLGIPNYFGMPIFISKTNLEVEIDILNSKKEVIAQYKAEGISKIPVAFYHGYGMMSASRMANITAVKMALKNINEQIEKDAPTLKTKLFEKGTIK